MKRNKIYLKRDPFREGKLYFIFCEGERKETTYFHFFNQITSQIIIQIVPINMGKNSPMGLFKNACDVLLENESNPNPEYKIIESDEVWFIIDTDNWGEEIDELRNSVSKNNNWFVAQSNPCFEVWLYYHFFNEKPIQNITNWKSFLNESIPGGFNPKKNPILIEKAIENSEINFNKLNGKPDILSTEVFILGKKLFELVRHNIELLKIK